MVAQHAFVRAAMFGNMFARREYGKHRGLHVGNGAQQTGGLRAARAVVFDGVAVDMEEESLPLLTFGEGALIR